MRKTTTTRTTTDTESPAFQRMIDRLMAAIRIYETETATEPREGDRMATATA